jgi:hypothetical protein
LAAFTDWLLMDYLGLEGKPNLSVIYIEKSGYQNGIHYIFLWIFQMIWKEVGI